MKTFILDLSALTIPEKAIFQSHIKEYGIELAEVGLNHDQEVILNLMSMMIDKRYRFASKPITRTSTIIEILKYQ